KSAKDVWLTEASAAKYAQSRQPDRYARHAREEAIVRRWLATLPARASVLDCPCGAGRFVPTVPSLPLSYFGADRSGAMIAEARKLAAPDARLRFARGNAEELPFADGSVDCVILWRLIHHVRDARLRQRMLAEAARVSRRMVLVSFHHPLSF